MHIEKIIKAEKESKRFLEYLQNLRKRIKKENNHPYFVTNGNVIGCKETGAVKRASMDLTRALADLRGRTKK